VGSGLPGNRTILPEVVTVIATSSFLSLSRNVLLKDIICQKSVITKIMEKKITGPDILPGSDCIHVAVFTIVPLLYVAP
jgi:hypothetical protein